MFPSIELELEDIESSWAGLRPLIHEEGKSTSELSRKDEIFTSDSGLISMAGGKLTGYRKMAERVVNRVAGRLKEDEAREIGESITAGIPLCGSKFKKFKHVKKYIEEILERTKDSGLGAYEAWYLVTTYGIQTELILEKFKNIQGDDPLIRLAKAELHFGIEYEMVTSPMDFFYRRTGRLYFDIDSIRFLMEPILEEFERILNPGKNIIDAWRDKLERELDEHSNFSVERI
jgi:glycerol-3-phosphate dehydrogenase